jgi:hypothetical protein
MCQAAGSCGIPITDFREHTTLRGWVNRKGYAIETMRLASLADQRVAGLEETDERDAHRFLREP